MGRPAKTLRSAIVTIKGKAREVNLSKLGLPRLRIDILKWRGHKQVEIAVVEETLDNDGEAGIGLQS